MDILFNNPLEDWFKDHDLEYIHPTILLICLLLIFIILIFFKSKNVKRKGKGSLYVITGITNSGKTALYSKLYHGKFDNTVSSLKENEGTFPLYNYTEEQEKYNIVDFPGHLEVKNKLMSTYLPKAKGIIFMIDAVSFPGQVGDVAGYLYTLLMSKTTNDLEIPFLIVCNKSDMLTAQSPEQIKHELEKELNQLRETRESMPGIQGENTEDDGENFILGYEKEDFQFNHVPFEVEFISSSVKDSSMNGIISFITRDN